MDVSQLRGYLPHKLVTSETELRTLASGQKAPLLPMVLRPSWLEQNGTVLSFCLRRDGLAAGHKLTVQSYNF